MHVRKLCNYIFFIIIINRFVTIVICLLLAEPLKRVFLTLTIICRNNTYLSKADLGPVRQVGASPPLPLWFLGGCYCKFGLYNTHILFYIHMGLINGFYYYLKILQISFVKLYACVFQTYSYNVSLSFLRIRINIKVLKKQNSKVLANID